MNSQFYQKLAESAKAGENLKATIKAQIFLQNLIAQKLSAATTHNGFMDHIEADAEAKLINNVNNNENPIIVDLASHVKELKKNRSFMEIMAEKKAADIARIDNLGAFVIPDVSSNFTEDPNSVATIYEEPELAVILAEMEENRLAGEPEDHNLTSEEILLVKKEQEAKGTQESFSLDIILNEDQLAAKEMALQGKTFCLVGAAGTGKTTTQREVAKALLLDRRLSTSSFKSYDERGDRIYRAAPSIAFVAFTRRAAANLAKAIWKDPILEEELKYNIMTIHALLEYEPVFYDAYDAVKGEIAQKFKFAPQRTATNPLNITHLVIEESSMLDAITLWKNLYEALPAGVQIIFIGDINQLPPVFGPSILNYALVQLPIIDLKKVYRNQGIVLENAHNILAGKPLAEDNNFVVIRGKSPTQVGQGTLARALGNMFIEWLDVTGSDGLPEYSPDDCIILSPFNKQELGTDNLNNWIAQHLGTKRGAIVHEVIAGFNKVYLAVGDKVMCNKLDGVITDIYRNPNYHGKEPQLPGSDLTRFGVRILGEYGKDNLDDLALDYSNFSVEALEADKAERKMQASYTVTVLLDNGKVEELSAAGDFGSQCFSLGYCLTVHKAQGSEWRKVFIILHKDHAVMLYRELFYTAVTRARTKVTIVAKDFVINKAIKNQRIKGNTVQDKIEYFNSGIMNNVGEPIYATK